MARFVINAESIAKRLSPPDCEKPARKSGDWWRCKCPVHNSETLALAIKDPDEGIVGLVVHCHGGCADEAVAEKLLEMGLWYTAPRPCTLENYADKLKLPSEFLLQCGLASYKHPTYGQTVRIPYFDREGKHVATRYRIALEGSDKFRWTKGDKPPLFGLSRLQDDAEEPIYLVEGESDCLTLWFEGLIALGLPGARAWNEERDAAHFDGFKRIYVVIEPDSGGNAVLELLRSSRIAERAHLIVMPKEHKDPAALWQHAPHQFSAAFDKLREQAMPWQSHVMREAIERRDAAKRKAMFLLCSEDILARADSFAHQHLNIAGENRLVQLTYLIITARILNRVCSMIVKGPSAAGKSYIVGQILKLFPPDAYWAMSSLSDKALIYGDQPLAHRMLVIYEAAGIASEFLTYIIRSLLSEGRLSYLTTEKNDKGKLVSRLIEREGPTGLLITTTEISLHPENETRCLSLTADDSAEQTAAVMRRQAQARRMAPDLDAWHALQTYLALSQNDVTIGFAEMLAQAIPPAAVRLRRDFPTLLALIEAHALLHQMQRSRTEGGAVIATIEEDYGIVRELVGELITEAAGVKKSKTMRETRAAVAELNADRDRAGVSVKEIAKKLELDQSAAWRRVRICLKAGVLRNLEERPRQKAKIVPGDEIDEAQSLLPDVEQLKALVAQREASASGAGA
jgi:hypothetical protein